ncbi:hypothetical protein [Asticcacaulis sp. YBE204]|uniref:hypothetical protein n=1 Tax=Asticcacaulis sp. YBE204 TaxID=1282363 RepID=UPI0003C3D2F2|nr:hypothetical protein [Asticcacaulis sp. YBE204]ESQ79186.1 hypothetical protein AEYBE204_09255 [Asticcacaulis sp. YBE204]
MTKVYSLRLLGLLFASAALTACASPPQGEKDYTVKTVKMSPAPRDKFYKIVKVPNAPKTQVCEPKSDAPQSGCAEK